MHADSSDIVFRQTLFSKSNHRSFQTRRQWKWGCRGGADGADWVMVGLVPACPDPGTELQLRAAVLLVLTWDIVTQSGVRYNLSLLYTLPYCTVLPTLHTALCLLGGLTATLHHRPLSCSCTKRSPACAVSASIMSCDGGVMGRCLDLAGVMTVVSAPSAC